MRQKLSNQVVVRLTRSVLALAIVTACAPQGLAQEIAPVTNHFFGAAAMAVGQTSRANIASYSDPDEFPAGTVCGIIINYFAADGTPLTSGFTGVLDIGKTMFVDLNRNSLKAPSNRVPFRVVVSVIGNPNIVPDPCADVRATVEIYDNLTGRTMVFIGDPNSR
jgi:hypothetical protein